MEYSRSDRKCELRVDKSIEDRKVPGGNVQLVGSGIVDASGAPPDIWLALLLRLSESDENEGSKKILQAGAKRSGPGSG